MLNLSQVFLNVVIINAQYALLLDLLQYYLPRKWLDGIITFRKLRTPGNRAYILMGNRNLTEQSKI